MSIGHKQGSGHGDNPPEKVLTKADLRLIKLKFRAYKRARRGKPGLTFDLPTFILAYTEDAGIRIQDPKIHRLLPTDEESRRKKVKQLRQSPRWWRDAQPALGWDYLRKQQRVRDLVKAAGEKTTREICQQMSLPPAWLDSVEIGGTLCLRKRRRIIRGQDGGILRESRSFTWQEPTPEETARVRAEIAADILLAKIRALKSAVLKLCSAKAKKGRKLSKGAKEEDRREIPFFP